MALALPYYLAVCLALMVAAHVALLVRVVRAGERLRALLAFVFPPLAPYYGWLYGAGRLAALWLGSLCAYAIGTAVAG